MEVVNETLSFENLTQFDEWKLQSGISLLLATEKCSSQNNESQNSFIPTISPAPNANHKKQVRFYSIG
jgi:hypothetical protein